MKTARGLFSLAAIVAAASAYAQTPEGDATAGTLPADTAAPAADSSAPAADAAPAGDAAAPADAAAAPADTSSSTTTTSTDASGATTTTETTSSESAPVTTESTELAAPSYLGILGLYTLPDSNRELGTADISHGTGAALLYGWQSKDKWGYELHGEVTTFETGTALRTDYYHYKLGADLFYAFGDRTHFTPFIIGGAGASYNDVYPNGAQDDGFDFYADAGVGFVTGPVTSAGQLRIRGEARYVYDHFGEHSGDVRFGLGVEIPLFAEKLRVVTATNTETTKMTDVPSGLTDSDGDGVVDSKDKCPDTPQGSRVDGDGCPFDKVIELRGVTFEFNKTRLRPDAQTILDWATSILTKYPDMKVEVAGHTDNVGGDKYNLKLSEGRAQAVVQYFVEHGVPATQLSAKGYGKAEPKADNKTAEGRELNRRVELRILN